MGGEDSMFRYADGTDKLLMFFGTLGSIGDGMQYPLTMFVLSHVINEYGSTGSSLSIHTVNAYSLKLLYVALAVGFSAFVEGVCWTRTAERQTSRMRMEYLKSVLRQEVGFFDTQEAGSSTTFQVVSTVSSDANSIQVAICEKIPDCLTYMSTFFFCLLSSFILSWKLALAALPLTLLFIVPGLVFGKLMMDVIMKTMEAYGIAGGIAEQAISSIRTVYSYVAESQTLNRFSSALEKTLELGIKQGFAKGLLMGSMGMIYVSWAFQAWVGTILVTEKGEKGGSVFVAGINIIMGGLSVLGALPNLTSITEAKAAATRIFEMINRTPAIDSEDKKGKAFYPSRPETLILQGLNLRIPAGKTVGIVGGSGSGKSTLVALLQRFYDPAEGDILLDGHKIRRLQLKWLRIQMGMNILFGKEGASTEDVINAAKAANAHDFIVKLPDGYETQVGQFGFQLSGGQKQRIAIARALIRDPRILLLDEATSALDSHSEKIVQEAIDYVSKGRTTITIAHRLSTIRAANLIVVLQAGRVVESGSHEELVKRNGDYFKMVQLQEGATHNVVPDDYNNNDGKNHHKMNIAQSPQSAWPSAPSTPGINPFSPGFSLGTPYSFSVHYNSDDESYEFDLNQLSQPAPSQWLLLKMNAPEWVTALIGSLAAIGSGAVQPINAYCVGLLIWNYFGTNDSAIKHKSRILSLVFLGIGASTSPQSKEKLLAKLMTFEIGWFDDEENTSASICAKLATEASTVRSLVGDRMSLLIQAFFGSLFAYILAIILSWRLALIMIAVQPLVVGSFYLRTVIMKSMAGKAQKAQKEGSQLASEAILLLFKATLRGPKEESVKHSWLSGLGLFSSQFFNTASTTLAYWYGGKLLTQGLITPEHLFQAFLILVFTAYVIAEAGSMTNDLSKGSNAVRSVFSILNRKSEIDPEKSWGLDIKKGIKGRVEFQNVLFAYPTRPDQMILNGLTLRFDAGRTVALVGPSGSGKSTIIGLIERFYDSSKGTVLIDGQDIKNYNLRVLRSYIALVSQEPTLFAGTIRENIVYGKENMRESEIKKAATLANAHEFISGMKDGYATYCGERGVQLSGGQKQRIALARAILKNPAILLLDEATSALDSVSESLVQEALEKMMAGRTSIVIAHRLSTIQKSDCIAVIKNGKVTEHGTHSELMSLGRRGAYYSLVKLQNGTFPEN
ncbi:hypothetical protein K2173_003112 [Erythroxylum novogranatense]|uniref:Uncharacterized protein n=1 Tax=Erythroxylum novogranatense TaxID=1862640 RepID=A0AAV8TBI5_9ROSI|nr:hypothetical protein K2173_003112 [Erythroxylum novogranatense]